MDSSDVDFELVVEGVASQIREAFSFLVTEHGYREAGLDDGMFSTVQYRRGETSAWVGWDLRENDLGVRFTSDRLERGATRERDWSIDLTALVALGGGRLADLVRAPRVVDREAVGPALRALADQSRQYGGSLLDGDWGGILERLRAPDESKYWGTPAWRGVRKTCGRRRR